MSASLLFGTFGEISLPSKAECLQRSNLDPTLFFLFVFFLPMQNFFKDQIWTPLFFLVVFFLGLHLQHMEVPRPGAELELQLQVYTPATATPHLSCIYDLPQSSQQRQILNPQSSQQRQILNPLSEARDRTHILTDTMPGS